MERNDMKIVLLAIASFIASNLFCQKKKEVVAFPFQVLVSKNVTNLTGKGINQFEFISIHDSLKIDKNGFISLIHISGFPLEYNNDTILSAKKINESLLKSFPKVRGRKTKYEYKRPWIEHLLIDDPVIARKEKLNRTGACMDCRDDYVIFPPRHNLFGSLVYHDGHSLCLKFRSRESDRYKIEVLNMFGELIDSLSISANELLLDTQVLKKWGDKYDFILLNIKDKSRNDSFMIALKKFPLTDIEFPWECEIPKASFAIMAGFYLEWSRGNYFEEAEKYYVLATKLSDAPFYQTMLENFRKRIANP
jgi:hypothetical protein